MNFILSKSWSKCSSWALQNMASTSQEVFFFVNVVLNIILGMIICIVLQMMTKKKFLVLEKHVRNLQVGLVFEKV